MNFLVCQRQCGMKYAEVDSMVKGWSMWSTLIGFRLVSEDGKKTCSFSVQGYSFAEKLASDFEEAIKNGEIERDNSKPYGLQPAFRTDRQLPLFERVDLGRTFVFLSENGADTSCEKCRYLASHCKI